MTGFLARLFKEKDKETKCKSLSKKGKKVAGYLLLTGSASCGSNESLSLPPQHNSSSTLTAGTYNALGTVEATTRCALYTGCNRVTGSSTCASAGFQERSTLLDALHRFQGEHGQAAEAEAHGIILTDESVQGSAQITLRKVCAGESTSRKPYNEFGSHKYICTVTALSTSTCYVQSSAHPRNAVPLMRLEEVEVHSGDVVRFGDVEGRIFFPANTEQESCSGTCPLHIRRFADYDAGSLELHAPPAPSVMVMSHLPTPRASSSFHRLSVRSGPDEHVASQLKAQQPSVKSRHGSPSRLSIGSIGDERTGLYGIAPQHAGARHSSTLQRAPSVGSGPDDIIGPCIATVQHPGARHSGTFQHCPLGSGCDRPSGCATTVQHHTARHSGTFPEGHPAACSMSIVDAPAATQPPRLWHRFPLQPTTMGMAASVQQSAEAPRARNLPNRSVTLPQLLQSPPPATIAEETAADCQSSGNWARRNSCCFSAPVMCAFREVARGHSTSLDGLVIPQRAAASESVAVRGAALAACAAPEFGVMESGGSFTMSLRAASKKVSKPDPAPRKPHHVPGARCQSWEARQGLAKDSTQPSHVSRLDFKQGWPTKRIQQPEPQSSWDLKQTWGQRQSWDPKQSQSGATDALLEPAVDVFERSTLYSNNGSFTASERAPGRLRSDAASLALSRANSYVARPSWEPRQSWDPVLPSWEPRQSWDPSIAQAERRASAGLNQPTAGSWQALDGTTVSCCTDGGKNDWQQSLDGTTPSCTLGLRSAQPSIGSTSAGRQSGTDLEIDENGGIYTWVSHRQMSRTLDPLEALKVQQHGARGASYIVAIGAASLPPAHAYSRQETVGNARAVHRLPPKAASARMAPGSPWGPSCLGDAPSDRSSWGQL